MDTDAARIRFDHFEADLRTHELRRDGRVVRLPNQSFLILAALLQQPGELVTREALRRRLWPEERFVDTEQSLNAAVNRLREALRDSADSPKYVETLPRRGYRFVGTVQPTPGASPEPDQLDEVTTVPERRKLLQGAGGVLVALVIVLSFALWITLRTSGDEPASSARLQPFTSFPEEEIAPSFAPDGQHIAFGWNGEGDGFDLYVKQGGAEKALRLTSKPARWISAAWSPDGGSIAFARDSDAGDGIYLIAAPLGGEERRLAAVGVTNSPMTQISWSPDGTRLVFSAYKQGRLALYEQPLDATDPHALEMGIDCWELGSPAYSPDGAHLAFVCTTSFGVYSIFTASPAGTSPRALTKVLGSPKGLTWSADSSRIIFSNDSGDGGGLWQVGFDGKVSRLVLGEGASMPSAGPSGAIAYARTSERIDIWRIDLQSASLDRDATRLLSSTRIQMNPRFAPDDARIAFQSTRSGSSEIWVANADGANVTRISSFDGPIAGAPAWCNDGKRLAFDSRASGVAALYIADVEERQPRRLNASVDNLALPAWSNDCRWLLASSVGDVLYIVSTESGDARRFTKKPSYYAQVSGDDVIFNVKEVRGVSLWRKRIDANEDDEQPLEGMPQLSYNDSWTVTATGIYFTLASEDPRALHFYRFATKTSEPVAQLAQPPAPAGGLGLSVSNGQRWLLYPRVEERQSDIMVIAHE